MDIVNRPYYVELWIEKDALISLFDKVASKKQVHLFPSRGYTSHTKIYEAQQRFAQQKANGKQCVLLYFGDLDPSGIDIFRNIANKFSSSDVKVERKALDADHVHDLIPIPVKDSDKRSDKFKEFMKANNLEGCYELDAMDAGELTDLASSSIDFYYNKELYPAAEIEEWKQQFDAARAEILKKLN
jgi:hypothetical protein